MDGAGEPDGNTVPSQPLLQDFRCGGGVRDNERDCRRGWPVEDSADNSVALAAPWAGGDYRDGCIAANGAFLGVVVDFVIHNSCCHRPTPPPDVNCARGPVPQRFASGDCDTVSGS